MSVLRSRINNYLLPNLVLPLADRLTRNKAWTYYNQFLASDHEPVEVKRARQWEKLRRLVQHAYDNTLYYRALMNRAGLTPDDIRTPEDYRRLPVTTKQDLRDHFPDGVIARNTDLSRVRISNTSGTAGRPLVLAQDFDDINQKYASKIRTRALMGAEIGDRVLRLAPNECQPCFTDGSSPDIDLMKLLRMRVSGHPDYEQARYIFVERKLVNPIVHQRTFPPPLEANFLDTGVERYLHLLVERRPEVLAGHPLYLHLVAELVERTGARVRGIKAVDCTGDLSTRRLRAYLADQFHAPVFQIYGGCEWGRMSGTCDRSDAMHLLDDLVYVEFLDPDGAPVAERTMGNIIVTSLTNTAMPLLRFEHGDVGWYTDEPCGCGRTGRRIDVEGRLQALIVRPDGKAVPSSAFMEALIPGTGIRLFKVVQQDDTHLEVRYLPTTRDRQVDTEKLGAQLRTALGDDIKISWKRVHAVEPAPSGKFRLVVSKSFQSFRCGGEEKRKVPLGEYW